MSDGTSPRIDPEPEPLHTERLSLEPITLAMVEAVLRRDRPLAERIARARMPDEWPGETMIHRGFGASLEQVRADPERRLWGDRLMISRDGERRILGSVIFHGRPDDDGVAEVGYGVDSAAQGLGLATEATRACVAWALMQREVRAVSAATFPWHRASLRVIEKLGMRLTETREHELLGELLVFTIDGAR